MKNFLIFISVLFLSCNSKEEQAELDYVKIDILPIQYHIPSSIAIDLKSKTISFSDLSQMTIVIEDCVFETFNPSVDFEYIKLKENELQKIKYILSRNFLNEIKTTNTEYLKDKETSDYLYGEGKRYRISIAKDSTTFSTEDFLILERKSMFKIYEILKIIEKHTKSSNNKKYIKFISTDFE